MGLIVNVLPLSVGVLLFVYGEAVLKLVDLFVIARLRELLTEGSCQIGIVSIVYILFYDGRDLGGCYTDDFQFEVPLFDQVDLSDEIALHLWRVSELRSRWYLLVQLLVLDENSERHIFLEVLVSYVFARHVLRELSNQEESEHLQVRGDDVCRE